MRIFIEHHALIATCVVVLEKGLLFLVEEQNLISRLSDPAATLECLWLSLISILPPPVDLLDVILCDHPHQPLISQGLFELPLKLYHIIIHPAYPRPLSQPLAFQIHRLLLASQVFAAPLQQRHLLLDLPPLLFPAQHQLLVHPSKTGVKLLFDELQLADLLLKDLDLPGALREVLEDLLFLEDDPLLTQLDKPVLVGDLLVKGGRQDIRVL